MTTTLEQLENEMARVIHTGKAAIDSQNEFVMMFAAMKNGTTMFVAMCRDVEDNEADKVTMLSEAVTLFWTFEADAVVHASDSWMTDETTTDFVAGNVLRPRDNPKRIEAIACSGFTSDRVVMWQLPYGRGDHGEVLWRDLQKAEPTDFAHAGGHVPDAMRVVFSTDVPETADDELRVQALNVMARKGWMVAILDRELGDRMRKLDEERNSGDA